MPLDELHNRKRRKNLALLALILAWCALIWLVTMAKMAHSAETQAPAPAASADFSADSSANAGDKGPPPHTPFIHQQTVHQQGMDAMRAKWRKDWDDNKKIRDQKIKQMDDERAAHQKAMDAMDVEEKLNGR